MKKCTTNSAPISPTKRKLLKKLSYSTPLLLCLGSLTKPQITEGTHSNPVMPEAIDPSSSSTSAFVTSDTHHANYNPAYGRVQRWLDTTRFWRGGLTNIQSSYTSGRATFDANEQTEYLNTYGFAQIQYGLPEPDDYNLGYLSRRSSGHPTDDERLTQDGYLLTRSFETERTRRQSRSFADKLLQTNPDFANNEDIRMMLGFGRDQFEIQANYSLAAYNYYIREFQTIFQRQGHTPDPSDPRLKDRLDYLREYDGYSTRDRDNLGESITDDIITKLRNDDRCDSLEDIFSQLCDEFDPYKLRD